MNQWNQMKAGDTFVFGSYAPSDMAQDGCKKLPITWQVLEKEDERMLVLSRQILDMQPFHNEECILRWEDSTLRQWLNSAFLNAAFTPQEQKMICTPEANDDPMGELLWQMFGMEDATSGISDRVFLLNQQDIMTYFPGEEPFFPGSEAEGTEYVQRMNGGDLCWWLRSSMRGHGAALIVSPCASIGASMIRQDNAQGVRPAMWVKL